MLAAPIHWIQRKHSISQRCHIPGYCCALWPLLIDGLPLLANFRLPKHLRQNRPRRHIRKPQGFEVVASEQAGRANTSTPGDQTNFVIGSGGCAKTMCSPPLGVAILECGPNI